MCALQCCYYRPAIHGVHTAYSFHIYTQAARHPCICVCCGGPCSSHRLESLLWAPSLMRDHSSGDSSALLPYFTPAPCQPQSTCSGSKPVAMSTNWGAVPGKEGLHKVCRLKVEVKHKVCSGSDSNSALTATQGRRRPPKR